MLGSLKLSSCAAGVEAATIILSSFMLPSACLLTKCIFRMELVVVTSIIEM